VRVLAELNNLNFIKDNIKTIENIVYETSIKSGRNPESVSIIAVSKRFPAEFARIAIESGIENLGENRVEELLEKKEILKTYNMFPSWHMIGTLQRKKVKKIIGNTSLIHSADSLPLISEISNCSKSKNIQTSILLQINISKEESKHGFNQEEILEKIHEILQFDSIKVRGLMTMAPLTQDEKELNKVFYNTKELHMKIKDIIKEEDFNILSMGMSNDYKIAIKNGATHIRVGSAIFGERKN